MHTSSPVPTAWHTLSVEQTLRTLTTEEHGLSEEEAAKRLAIIGPNRLAEAKRASKWMLLLDQFRNFLIIILLIAALLSGVLGEAVEAAVIAVIVLFAALLGFLQEVRAEKAIDALRRMAAPTALVVRGLRERVIPSEDVVPGDIVLLKEGDRIPADARLLSLARLMTEEAPLTGESLPVTKQIDPMPGESLPLGDRRCMVFAGTSITSGRGRAVVVATGMQTEFGKIAGMLQTVETGTTPLQRSLDRVGKTLAKAAFVLVLIISGAGILRGQPMLEMIVFGIALAVAVVPEALPAVVTISLALGVQRMARRHALVRRLPAVETLGSTSVICTDKTGTLTKDEMTVHSLFVAGRHWEVTGTGYDPTGDFSVEGAVTDPDASLLRLLRTATLASDARLVQHDGRWDIHGDPTEGSLVVAAAKAGFQKTLLDQQYPRTAEIPFSSDTKRMTTMHTGEEGTFVCVKGAPEVILSSCTNFASDGDDAVLSPNDRERILREASTMADQALRVLAIATRQASSVDEGMEGLVFLGLVGMMDPPRPEAASAVARCKRAGIRTVMITGDHPATAQAIARTIGILQDGEVVTGSELDTMDDRELQKRIASIQVFARVSPAHKLRLVTALQERGEIVAMTGDGVNDAPALKKADIGIAMGITGTDVTREAAAMTLTDDNFASIVAAVEEGRGIYGNIKKYLMYLLSSNIGEIGLMALATILGYPLPLSAVQLLYVNLATDGLPALALAVDPPERDLMSHPPRDRSSGIFSRSVVLLMLTGGLWSALLNMGIFWWGLRNGRSVTEAMTLTFVSLILIQFFKAYAFRSDHLSTFLHPFRNRWLNYAILWELVLLFLVVTVPFLERVFQTTDLSWGEVIGVILLTATVLPVLEAAKWLMRRSRR